MRNVSIHPRWCLSLSVLVLAASAAHAVEVYSEPFDGDISGDRLNPTGIPLSLGVNSVIARTGFSTFEDQEYFRIDLPAGTQLSQLNMAAYDVSSNGIVFLGVQEGTTFGFDPSEAFSRVGELLGWVHFGPGNGDLNGDDLLPDIGMGQGAMGFAPPLAGSSYTFWIQQFDDDTSYQLDFVVTQVPEPTTWIGLLLGGLLLMVARSRR